MFSPPHARMSQSVSSPPTYEAAAALPSQDVHLADIKTIAFDDWAINHLSVVQKNRLRRAVNHYHTQIRASAALDPPAAEAAPVEP